MNVLVTGGAGFIGCWVVRELLKRGHNPIVFDTFYWGKDSLKAIEDKIKIIEGDCRNSRDVVYALEGADAVIHLAGIVGEAACLANPKTHFTSNIESTRILIDCCTDIELGLIPDFIFASSCSVYGNTKGMYAEVTEELPIHPISAYAHAKLVSERIILEHGKKIPHFHPTVLRLTTVFGWSERPRLDLFSNLFAYEAWKDKRITIHGDGQQYRSLIHGKDIATAFVDVLEASRFKRSGRVFHVGEESNNIRISKIAEIVKNLIPGTEIEYFKEKATDRRDYSVNCQKIKNVIGWKAECSIEEGLKDLIEKFDTLDLDWESHMYRNNLFNYV